MVQAINAVGASAFSPVLTTFAAVVPSTPLNLEIVTSASGTIDLSWEASQYDGGSPILGYYVEYRLSTLTVFSKTSLISATDFAT